MKDALKSPVGGRTCVTAVIVLSLAVVPHIVNLSPLVGLSYVGLVAIRLIGLRRPSLVPGKRILLLLTLTCASLVYTEQKMVLGRDVGVALLVLMVGLKLLELRSGRDVYVAVFMGYFVVVTQFLYHQSILLAAYLAIVVWLLTAMLVQVNGAHNRRPIWFGFTQALVMLIQALPIMGVLFVFFPRLTSPLWALPTAEKTAVSGLSDEMEPGSIARIVESDAVAFRVEFLAAAPEPSKRYWRGPVLWHTDGRRWSALQPVEGPLEYRGLDPKIEYEITLEPHQKNWLFALDLPAVVPDASFVTEDFQLRTSHVLTKRVHYRIASHTEYLTPPPTDQQIRNGLQLPENVTGRTRRLVADWVSAGGDPEEVIRQALAYFREQQFFYTLSPPSLADNPVDQFMFETRRGFCEHYASAFVTLMRLAGIPARIVTGYQGGEFNPLGNYFIIRQSDAHAWAEVWSETGGWMRVDPTSSVAPERIEKSIDRLSLENGEVVRFRRAEPDALRSVLRHLGFGVDTLNTVWNRWVLEYGEQRQNQIFSWFGLGRATVERLAAGMLIGFGIAVLVVGATMLRTNGKPADPVLALYRRFCRKLGRHGLIRAPFEGPTDFALRGSRSLPQAQGAIEEITRLYIALRYGRVRSKRNLKRLRRLIRGLRV